MRRGRSPGRWRRSGTILRYALRRGYITDNPLRRLEAGERPRPVARPQRALGQDEIARLLAACASRYRLLIATALYTGTRISELLALTWADVEFGAGVVHVRAQLSRAHQGVPARRVTPKTAAAIRDIPLVDQLSALLRDQRQTARFADCGDYIFATSNGTPLGHRNVERRALQRAAATAGITPAPRFHDLRHTFASHLIIDLGLDVAQVSRILGHASVTTTHELQAATRPPGGRFGAPELVAKADQSGSFPRWLLPSQVQIASDGAVVALWREGYRACTAWAQM